MSDAVLMALERHAQACAALGAPFCAGLLERAMGDTATGGVTSRLFAPWVQFASERVYADAVALRLLAAMRYLALSGRAPELYASYPPHGSDIDRAWAAAQEALTANEPLARDLMAHEPQTNEVRRSACLLGGFLLIAQDTGLPLRCFEIGASAGLNSLWDKFRYRIGGATWGEAGSPIVLDCRWGGPAPSLELAAQVVERRACDRRPVDIRQPDEAVRLLSYVWPEQSERLARLRAAIDLAQACDLKVEAGEASTWVRQARPLRGAATVVFQSVVMQYMPPAEQASYSQAVARHGARATCEAPFAWLRMEPSQADQTFQLRLKLWPTGEDRLLADVHPHGEFAIWR